MEQDRLYGRCTLVTEMDREEDRRGQRVRKRQVKCKKRKDVEDREMIREIRYERDEESGASNRVGKRRSESKRDGEMV